MKQSTWLITNELQEPVKALELVKEFLDKASQDTYYWKWVLVAMHNAIQGFMVCALRGSDGMNVLKDHVVGRWLEAKKNNLPLPKLEMDTFLNLFNKIQSDRMLMHSRSKKFSAGEQHTRSMRRLNKLRNHFVHFTPKSWSMEISSLPLITLQCMAVIKFLVFSSGNIELKQNSIEELGKTIDHIEICLESLMA